MSGHSKWSTIKHKKAAKDAKRGKQFAKLIRAIEVAARSANTSDPEQSPSLALAVQKAATRASQGQHRARLQARRR
jgi:transcriptional/translational regulatory protein YebC/TACO1